MINDTFVQSLEPGGEGRKNALDKCRDLMERFEQRLTLDNPRLIQRYLESKLQLRIRFFIDSTDVEFEAFFQREPLVGGIKVDAHGFKRLDSIGGKGSCTGEYVCRKLAEVYACGLRTNRKQQAVLLNVVAVW